VHRSNYPSGTASSALLKALHAYVRRQKGTAAADAWLKALRLEDAELVDETRPVPLSTIHRALALFVQTASKAEIERVWTELVAADNLGAYLRVVRGAHSPSDALSRLESAESEYGRTTRWETLLAGSDEWRGRMHYTHDPQLEADGLLTLGRIAELSAIPALFGFGRATFVSCKPVVTRAGPYFEFEVRWKRPRFAPTVGLSGALGGIAGALPMVAHWASGGAGAAIFVGATVTGAAVGALTVRERERRAEAHAQTMRVRALERSIVLKEERDKLAAQSVEGTLVAAQFRIVRRMGSGASGVIYEAVRIGDGLRVAIKLLRAAAAHDAVASDRLRREAEALGLAWHPNVVEVIDHGILPDGTSYLVMELLSGESLSTRLRTRGRLGPEETLAIATQVCEALSAVHAAGVVHRDLKPSNIFLARARDESAARETVKLLDFGIARVEWEETRITNMGAPLGTPGYMSPEQERGGLVDARSDLFALGATLYECLVGEPPPPLAPSGVTRTAPGIAPGQLSSLLGGSRFDWSSGRTSPYVSHAWRVVLERAMATDPEERFQDARGFALALRELRADLAQSGARG
jgi:serine/threonine-protein kinase